MSSDLLSVLVDKAFRKEAPTREEAHALLAGTEPLIDVVAAGSRIRREFFGMRVKLNTIVNMKSGLCPEDCGYCSQRLGSEAEVLKYSWVAPERAAQIAGDAVNAGAKRVCLVASGRGPGDRDLTRIENTIAAIKTDHPQVEICVCLGLLNEDQAGRLAAAGAHAYSHNLNTAEDRYADVCTTHTFADRVQTVGRATAAGLSPCSGAIFGMGETDTDIVNVAFALRELDPDSVPVNFLIPFDGTPLGEHWDLTPDRCLRILALFRFFFPDVEVRLAGGREIHLRGLQPMALHLANSIFLGDYLTSEGQPGSDDRQMIVDAGFVIEGADEPTLPSARHDLVSLRRRGAGTALPSNT
ncbi:biotin synthase BioB [Mycobacterium attenuatum]|uniref:biotin synthase BioB n=1 Tax=Mycobacterium attenuatum TaxID=2341086 RepID=UPI000F03ACEB|nr:biotin synthase BioB [Mycobacterium attenuatum]VBA62419.1 Biotin synthase [Mycobacterium attenuatum]